MSGLPIESTEPDPAATSLPNDQALNMEAGDSSAPTAKDTIMADTEIKPANGTAEAKGDVVDAKEENGTVSDTKEGEDTDNKDENNRKRKARTDEKGVLKTSSWEYRGKSGSKYNPEVLPVTDDPKLIRAQVEFYFSDSNLPMDKFLWETTDGSSNKPVSVHTICQFGRMKRFQPESAVISALRESSFLVVSGEEGEEKVCRKVPFDSATQSSRSEPRSIYAKGFGDEEPGSQFDIEAFFAPYGPTRSVRLRRTDEKLFKGSVFVEFQDEETAKKFLELDPKPLWKGHPLDIKSKKEYMEGKEQDIRDGKIQPQLQRNYGRGRGRGRGFRGGNRGNNGERGDRRGDKENRDRDPDDWKKRREEDRASGFKDNRKDGRGRGRGRGRREDRGPRNDRNQEREEKGNDKETKVEASSEDASNGQKRSREEDGSAEEKPAKKVQVEA